MLLEVQHSKCWAKSGAQAFDYPVPAEYLVLYVSMLLMHDLAPRLVPGHC
jgi:hypothetical protein